MVSGVKGKPYISIDRTSWHIPFVHAQESVITQTDLFGMGLEMRVPHPTVDCEIGLERKYTRESGKPANELIRYSGETLSLVYGDVFVDQ